MPTKKVTKKEIKIEEIATKTIDDVSADLITTQNKIRASISAIGDALLTKRAELDDLLKANELAKEELKEISDKEKLAMSIQELKEEFEDTKHEHERKLAQLKVEYEDKQEALERAYQASVLKESRRQEDEERARRIQLEDEDRIIQLKLEDREGALVAREQELEEKQKELGSFEDRIKTEVDRQVRAAQISTNFEKQSLKKDAEAEIKILGSQVSQLEILNKDLTDKLQRSEDQVEAANNRANNIAMKSIEKESGKMALDKIEAIAQEQAKSGKK